MALQRELRRLDQPFAKYALAACVRDGLELQGFALGDPLPPQAALEAAGCAAVRRALAEHGVLPGGG